MEHAEHKTRLIKNSHVTTNYATYYDNGSKCSLKKDVCSMSYKVEGTSTTNRSRCSNSSPEMDEGKRLESHGISIVDSKTQSFSNVTPKECSDYYKSLGEWQNILPKTDYTYSPLSTYHRKKINGVFPVIPNMSREGIWSSGSSGTSTENEVSLYSAKNYEYEEIYGRRRRWLSPRILRHRIQFDQISVMQKSVRKVRELYASMVKVVNASYTSIWKTVHRSTSRYASVTSSSSWSNFSVLKPALLIALLALLAYFVLHRFPIPDIVSGFSDTVSTPFTNVFAFLKSLVYNLYELTCLSANFVISLISGFCSRAPAALHTLVFTPLHKLLFLFWYSNETKSTSRYDHQQSLRAEDLSSTFEEVLQKWLVDNKESIAKTVASSSEFEKFINEKLKSYEETENARFEKILDDYDFEKTNFGQKLKMLEIKVTEWRTEDVTLLREQISILRDQLRKTEERLKTDVIVILQSVTGVTGTGDSSPEDALRSKFDSLFRYVDDAHTKIHVLSKEFSNHVKNSSENFHMMERLRTELQNELWLAVDELISSRLDEWKRTMMTNESRAAGAGSETKTTTEYKTTVTADHIDDLERYVKEVVRKALEIYDADKTGQADFALESQGGTILSTRCTETLTTTAKFFILGIPFWHASRTPRTVIQPGVHPGECWAFPGSTGYLVIQLSEQIMITGFTMEHIPKSLAANGTIESAPKNFSVWGLQREMDSEPKFLGEFVYDESGSSVQYFEAVRLAEPYRIVELRILSNYGKMEYTCLYRFRVHGIPA